MNPSIEKTNPNSAIDSTEAQHSVATTVDVATPRIGDPSGLADALMADVNIDEVIEQETDNSAALEEYAINYLDMFMADPYLGGASIDNEKMDSFRAVFSRFVISNLDADSVINIDFPDQKLYNPVLQEFAGLLASVDHNSGVYYERDEVEDIFKVISGLVVEGEPEDEATGIESGDSQNTGKAIKNRVRELMSISSGQSIALVKDEDGAWKAIDYEYNKSEDFTPLEVTRQDNDDKGGKNKYRFRKPIYTRSQSSTHSKQVAEGWYTSEWHDEPSYWSGELRALLTDVVADTAQSLDETNSSLVFISEGGIFKGTSTAETDIDTACFISCDSVSKFDGVFETVTNSFNQRLEDVPFATKDDPIRPRFYDRTTKTLYHRHEDGSYTEADYEKLVDGGSVVQTIRKNEKGLAIVTRRNGLNLHSKSEQAWDEASIDVAINLETGEAVRLSDEDLERLKPKPRVVTEDELNVVW